MGRETKYLLALLGLLAGVFLGVVSLKLFVPRPPEGAGPDVHGDIATSEAQALVEPPELSPPPAVADASETAPPPLAADAGSVDQHDPTAPPSRFGGGAAADGPRDPAVVAASYEAAGEPAEPAPPDQPRPPAELQPPPPSQPPADLLPPPAFERPVALQPEADLLPPPAFTSPPREAVSSSAIDPALPPPAASLGETYVTRPGDSWWSLAERAYGDGRLYRALFAWNRMLDPRVSLAPGTTLEIPPAAKLGATWPGLLPRD